MKRSGAAVLAICGTLGGPAAAASCVGMDLETPLPGATGVETRHADLPSALFGGMWQQGMLNDVAYRVYANATASIGDAPAMAGWRLDLACDPEARRCDRATRGDEPPESLPVAGQIEACLLGPEPAPPPPAAPVPTAENPSDPAAPQQTAEAPGSAMEADAPPPAEVAPAALDSAPQESGTPGPAPAAATPVASAPAAAERDRQQAPEPRQGTGTPSAPARHSEIPAEPQPGSSEQTPPDSQRQATSEPRRAADAPAAPDLDPPATPAPSERPEPQAGRAEAGAEDDAPPGPVRQVPATDSAPSPDGPREDAATDTVEPMQLLESDDGAPATEPAAPEASPVPAAGVVRPGRPHARPIRPEASEPPEGSEGPAILPLPARESSPARAAPAARTRPDAAVRSPTQAGSEQRAGRTRQPQPPAARTVAPKPEAPPSAPEQPASFRTSCTLGSSVALDDGKLSSTLGCTLNYRNRLTASLSVIGYPREGQKRSGDAEYTYALTWRMTKNLTLTYANYTAAFTEGRGLAGLGDRRLQLSRRLPPLDLPGTRRKLGCSAFASAAPQAPENAGLSCGPPLTDKLTLRTTGYLYLPGAQRDSDPDFSYSASWRLGPQVTLTWSNYANNRWFWNGSDQSEKFLHGGSLGFTYTTRF